MSRPEIILCDRCGKETPTWRGKADTAKLHLWAPGQARGCGEQRIDLCLDCYERFIDFLESDMMISKREEREDGKETEKG